MGGWGAVTSCACVVIAHQDMPAYQAPKLELAAGRSCLRKNPLSTEGILSAGTIETKITGDAAPYALQFAFTVYQYLTAQVCVDDPEAASSIHAVGD